MAIESRHCSKPDAQANESGFAVTEDCVAGSADESAGASLDGVLEQLGSNKQQASSKVQYFIVGKAF